MTECDRPTWNERRQASASGFRDAVEKQRAHEPDAPSFEARLAADRHMEPFASANRRGMRLAPWSREFGYEAMACASCDVIGSTLNMARRDGRWVCGTCARAPAMDAAIAGEAAHG